jgi:putative ABC transport system permease protein
MTFRNLARHPLRTGLALAGLAVTTALLLDMVLLSGGIERSFEKLLLGRGFQIRISPKGTLPFDTEATIPGVSTIQQYIAADSAVEAVGPFLGTSVYARRGDSLVTLFGYGIDPRAQGLYQLVKGRDLAPEDTLGLLLSTPAAAAIRAGIGDTVTLVGVLDPEVAHPAVTRRVVVRGTVRWLYDYRGQRSVGGTLPLMQSLARLRADDRASALVVRVRDNATVERVVDRLRARFPYLEVNSVAAVVARFRERLVYFRQLSRILGSISLIVTVLLVSTLMTITVNERLGEIATLRAIGVTRGGIVRRVVLEGALLTVTGGALGAGLGVITARFLDRILASFPGLPAAISFFVPETASLIAAGLLLLATGIVAGAYPAFLAASAPIAATLHAEAM